MAPAELLLDLFWIASGLLAATVLVLLALRDTVWATRALLAVSALSFLTLFGFFLSGAPEGASSDAWVDAIKQVAWVKPLAGTPAVEVGFHFSKGSLLLLLILALVPGVALLNPKLFRTDSRNDRQLVALLPLIAAAVFGFFAAGFWSILISGALVLMSMAIAFSSQWEFVGESQAMERTLRDFLMGLLLVSICRWYLSTFAQSAPGELLLLAALLFNRIGPFYATAAQDLILQGSSWRRLTLEWMPRLTGLALVALLLFESGRLPEMRGWVVCWAAAGILLTVFAGLAASGSKHTSGRLLASLGIWGLAIASVLDAAHFRVLYVWLFMSGWSVLSLQDLVRTSATEKAQVTSQGVLWVRVSLFIFVAALLGAPGWLGGTLVLAAFQYGLTDVAAQIGLSLGFLAFALLVLVWATRLWREARSQATLDFSLTVPIITACLFLAIAWDGSLTGGWLEDGGAQPDLIAAPYFASHFGLGWGGVSWDARLWVFSGFFLALIVCAILMRGGLDRASQLQNKAAAFYRVMDQGFGAEHAAEVVWSAVARVGRIWGAFWTETIWERGIYRPSMTGLTLVAQSVHGWGLRLDGMFSLFVRAVFRAPALITQAFQDGDLRWYVFWGVLTFGLVLLRQGWFAK